MVNGTVVLGLVLGRPKGRVASPISVVRFRPSVNVSVSDGGDFHIAPNVTKPWAEADARRCS